MVCPMRVFIGLGSVLLLLGIVAFTVAGYDEPAFLATPAARRRSRLRFCAALFTGELLYEWYFGRPWAERPAAAEACDGGAAEDAAGAAGAEGNEPEAGAGGVGGGGSTGKSRRRR